MQNIVINVCEKFHYDRLRNDRALGNRKFDNNKNKMKHNKNNVGLLVVFGASFPGPKMCTASDPLSLIVGLQSAVQLSSCLKVRLYTN